MDYTQDEYGVVHIKETETHFICLQQMIFNWRLVTAPKDDPLGYDRGWCYFGTDKESFTKAALAAEAWDGAEDTEPPGWNKNIKTGEIRREER